MYLKGWVILQMDNRNTCSLRCYLILNIIHLSEETVYLSLASHLISHFGDICNSVCLPNVQLVIDITGTKISQILRYQLQYLSCVHHSHLFDITCTYI